MPVGGSFDLGFLGGGQLARMSIQAAQAMGLRCLSVDPDANSPASQICEARVAALHDESALSDLFGRCDRVTLENEFVRADSIESAVARAGRSADCLTPSLEALRTIQDKLRQREAYAAAGVPSPKAVALEGDGAAATREIGFPMVLKARFGGYDGKGTRYAKTEADFEELRAAWAAKEWLAEAYVPFRRELAVMAFVDGASTGCFPTMETLQTNHVCDWVRPAAIDATQMAIAAVRAVGGRGLFGVELFETAGGELLVNEIAPRPHNSGHYTLDWGGVSQFEQHVRLSMGLPTAIASGGSAVMANLLGQEGAGDFRAGIAAALEVVPDARIHWYGKAESRVGRKMGHINLPGDDLDACLQARDCFYRGWTA